MYSVFIRSIEDIRYFDEVTSVFPWAAPVPFFGRVAEARVATVGINPSYREFVDSKGIEFPDSERRLETLRSLNLDDWSQANGFHVRKISEACVNYFEARPYRGWFDVLDRMLSSSRVSYYENAGYHRLCHLDLVPHATRVRWGDVPENERNILISRSRSMIMNIIRDSSFRVIVLNGEFVVRQFERFAGVKLERELVEEWSIPRQDSQVVAGFAYHGTVSSWTALTWTAKWQSSVTTTICRAVLESP